MAIVCILLIIAVGTFAIFKLVMWSRDTGNNIGNVISLVIALIMMVMMSKINQADENPKPAPRVEQVQTTTAIEAPVEVPAATPAPESIYVAPRVSQIDSQDKIQVENYLRSLPGATIVIVRSNDSGITVDCDIDMGNVDKETAKSLATNLIYAVMSDNDNCTFSWISVNCMNGKSPIGMIVHYDNGAISSLP